MRALVSLKMRVLISLPVVVVAKVVVLNHLSETIPADELIENDPSLLFTDGTEMAEHARQEFAQHETGISGTPSEGQCRSVICKTNQNEHMTASELARTYALHRYSDAPDVAASSFVERVSSSSAIERSSTGNHKDHSRQHSKRTLRRQTISQTAFGAGASMQSPDVSHYQQGHQVEGQRSMQHYDGNIPGKHQYGSSLPYSSDLEMYSEDRLGEEGDYSSFDEVVDDLSNPAMQNEFREAQQEEAESETATSFVKENALVIGLVSCVVFIIGALVGYYQTQQTEQERDKRQSMKTDLSADTTRQYNTIVHTLDANGVARQLHSSLSEEDGAKCSRGACGISDVEAKKRHESYGPNKITPPVKENRWVALARITFLSGFNILLWACVTAEIVLGALLVEEHIGNRRSSSDWVTPVILSIVILSASLLQWWSEQKAESMMESLQSMQGDEDVIVLRHRNAFIDNAQDGDAQSGLARLEMKVNPGKLVVGDIIVLYPGTRIPADCRILHCTDGAEVDQAALTGESLPELRISDVLPASTFATEARNLVFFGTLLIKGNLTCMVHAIGDNTLLGKIAQGVKRPRPKSSMEIAMEHFVHLIAIIAIIVGVLTAVAEWASGKSPRQMLESSSAALFGQIPEGLLPTATISLLIASYQMADSQVLVRKLDAVETLGCVDVICSDKTGTLTSGEMTATDVVDADGKRIKVSISNPRSTSQALDTLWRAGILNTAVTVENEPDIIPGSPGSGATGVGNASLQRLHTASKFKKSDILGSPTETAVFYAAMVNAQGPFGSYRQFPEVFTIPFNSENKYMLTVHEIPESPESKIRAAQTGERDLSRKTYICIVKGAPDRVLKYCKQSAGTAAVEEQMKQLMSEGKRIIALAECIFTDTPDAWKGSRVEDVSFSDNMSDLKLLGLFGIEDPPKAGVKEAVLAAKAAGVKTVMVTGDHPDTARAIAKQLEIVSDKQKKPLSVSASVAGGKEEDFFVIEGARLDAYSPVMDDFGEADPAYVTQFWKRAVVETRVFARVSPLHKQIIVQAYQKWGKNGVGSIVAMTGDGVNDGPALKTAEVGIAMGIRGTEVAKDAAAIILLDDNFSSIVKGIEQGRLSSDNLRKSIMYTLCSKIPQFLPTLGGVFGLPTALTITQILAIDIGTDIWTSIAYALQPSETALMNRSPRHPREELLVDSELLLYSYGYMGLMQTVGCVIMYTVFFPANLDLIESGKRYLDYDENDFKVYAQGTTVYYWTLVVGQIAAAYCATTMKQSLWTYGVPNVTLNLMIMFEILLGILHRFLRPTDYLGD